MISRQLIDLLNSGEAVAVVGSGASSDAGLPTWDGLFTRIADGLDSENHDTYKARAVAATKKLPEAFDLLVGLTSRQDIHTRVKNLIGRVTSPGRQHAMLADWPFRLYITTNYDHLIEHASSGRVVAVGNRGVELHKLSGGVREVVWHIHGGSELSDDISQIVVTKSDYDDVYPASNTVEKLKAISTMHRCVFIGFGFTDEDLLYVLQAIGRLAHSGRPSFAFLAYDKQNQAAKKHQDHLRSKFNVEVIPYYKHGHDHSDLHRLLNGYQPFVVRRSISLGQAPNTSPTYDPLTSSLKIQNSLNIGELSAINVGLRSTLVGARVLSLIRENPGGQADISIIYRAGDPSELEVLSCLANLRMQGLVTPPPALDLTSKYHTKSQEAQGQLALAGEQFRSSLRQRAIEGAKIIDEPARERVVATISYFMDDLCKKRGLGVAQNLASSDTEQTSLRSASLIQKLPEHFHRCNTRDEVLAVICLTADILTQPTGAEAAFLGLLCQAYFGQHLAGASNTLADVDLDLISGTCYLLDASVLVCLLAEGNEVHKFTSRLIADLGKSGAILVTTDLFVDEIVEHANWPSRLVQHYGELSDEVVNALRCLGGYRPNLFLKGYFSDSQTDSSFSGYLSRVLAKERTDNITNNVVNKRLSTFGIQVLRFDEWDGYDQDLILRRKDVQKEIHSRRSAKMTYKHPRQTKAEAEVALIVDGVRRRKLQPPGFAAKDAFFLSSTRVVDRLPDLKRRICLRPEGLAQWLWSSQSTSPQHAELVFEHLLWEMALGGIEFVNRTTLLRRFSGIFEAAETELSSAIRERRESLVDKYGTEPSKAFTDADPFDLPRFNAEVQQEIMNQMNNAVASARRGEEVARAAARISEKERNELTKLRQRQAERRRKFEKKRRSTQSSKKGVNKK
jgi:hypothetical protein